MARIKEVKKKGMSIGKPRPMFKASHKRLTGNIMGSVIIAKKLPNPPSSSIGKKLSIALISIAKRRISNTMLIILIKNVNKISMIWF